MLEILKKSLDDFSAGRWDDFKSLLVNDVIYEELATGVKVQGVDAFIDVLRKWRRAFPDVKATVLNSLQSGDQVVAEVEWQGTHSGAFESPMGTLPATNNKGRVKAAIIMTFKNGKIATEHHYFDLLGLLKQIGVALGPGAIGQAAAKTAEPQPKQ